MRVQALTLCVLAAVCAVSGEASETGVTAAGRRGRVRVTRRTLSDRWLQTIAELLGDPESRKSIEDHALRVQLPIGGPQGQPLPVLLLPVPVPVPVPAAADTRDTQEQIQTEIRRQFRPTASFQVRDDDPKPEQGVSPEFLVELFKKQKPRNPSLPPLLLEESPPRGEFAPGLPRLKRASGFLSTLGRPLFGQKQQSSDQPSGPDQPPGPSQPPLLGSQPPPPPLRFNKSVMLRGELTVNRADYTEPYTAWYDAATGSSRVDVHGGMSSMYRIVGEDGMVRRVSSRMERTDENEQGVRRCMVMRPTRASAADRAAPALPDLDKFLFDGYEEDADGGQVERWRYLMHGTPGDAGAARGEALFYRHELIATRAPDGSTVPLKYTVIVDSTVLGPNSDTYEHRYLETRDVQPDINILNIDIDRECGTVEQTDRMELVDSLREFTMLVPDPKHAFSFLDFVTKFGRKYVNSVEEALRKNLLMQNMRFIESANRQGGTAKLALNWLSDRLEEELETLLGIAQSTGILDAEKFPYSRAESRSMEDRLPDEFDWREQGGVTHVRYQGNCPACWAFSVVAAVEGALFVRTRRLVALSDKCLLDCGHKAGKDTCSPTWLDAPYAHLQNRGILALDDYEPYEPKVDQCRDNRTEPVTFISAYVNVTTNSVPALKVAIRRHGPTVVLVDGKCKSFQYYKSGVLQDYRCIRELKKLNHAVTAVGWGKKPATHFILKNSWAASYGENGYIRVHGPSNTCGVLTSPTYPRVEDSDVHRLPAADSTPRPDEQAGGAQL